MALEATFRQLSADFQSLDYAFHALQLSVGDRPPDDGAALSDDLENMVLDVVGALRESCEAASDARCAVTQQVDLDRATRALSVCHERFHQVTQMFSANLLSYDKLRELVRLGKGRGGEWLPWASGTKQAIEDCRRPMEEVCLSMGRCWQEIAEHAGATSVSVRTMNIGQKIIAKPSEAKDVGYGGIT